MQVEILLACASFGVGGVQTNFIFSLFVVAMVAKLKKKRTN
jgi:hypothetical protein